MVSFFPLKSKKGLSHKKLYGKSDTGNKFHTLHQYPPPMYLIRSSLNPFLRCLLIGSVISESHTVSLEAFVTYFRFTRHPLIHLEKPSFRKASSTSAIVPRIRYTWSLV